MRGGVKALAKDLLNTTLLAPNAKTAAVNISELLGCQ